METLLLLFTHELPCWDEETVILAGENPTGLRGLVESGDLMPMEVMGGKGYVLTPQGVRTRERVSLETGVPAPSVGEVIIDTARARDALELNRMAQFIDRAFVTDWGIKETTVRETFPVIPCLSDGEYFQFEGERVKATWPDAPLVKSFVGAFPHCDFEARKFPAPGQEGLDRWVEANHAPRGTLTIDLVLRSRADFDHYRKFNPVEGDKFKFVDVDPLFVQKVKAATSPEDLLSFIGKFHVFLMGQRRVYIPGWFDFDHSDQEDWTMLCLVTDTEAELKRLTTTLRRWGHDLIDPANPLYLIGTSCERMRNQKEQKRILYDWFQEETVRILRPDAPDEEWED
ncbi:MAG: hypothetical protein IJU98_05610 [Synergistaceae bacterium]|nr:hypothetical protein [Synergistaceae bacterium]